MFRINQFSPIRPYLTKIFSHKWKKICGINWANSHYVLISAIPAAASFCSDF